MNTKERLSIERNMKLGIRRIIKKRIRKLMALSQNSTEPHKLYYMIITGRYPNWSDNSREVCDRQEMKWIRRLIFLGCPRTYRNSRLAAWYKQNSRYLGIFPKSVCAIFDKLLELAITFGDHGKAAACKIKRQIKYKCKDLAEFSNYSEDTIKNTLFILKFCGLLKLEVIDGYDRHFKYSINTELDKITMVKNWDKLITKGVKSPSNLTIIKMKEILGDNFSHAQIIDDYDFFTIN